MAEAVCSLTCVVLILFSVQSVISRLSNWPLPALGTAGGEKTYPFAAHHGENLNIRDPTPLAGYYSVPKAAARAFHTCIKMATHPTRLKQAPQTWGPKKISAQEQKVPTKFFSRPRC